MVSITREYIPVPMRSPSPPLFALLFSLLLPEASPGQTATLGRASFNGLQARVAAIRFFESGGAAQEPSQRVFTTRFDALTTRFIFFELELAYTAARRQTAFQVDCVFEGPGGVQQQATLTGTVQPGWTGSYHAARVGSPERGRWVQGLYKVGCREGGQSIVATQLEVVKSVAAVGRLGAAVVQLKFFQSLAERAPVETRRYSTRFDARTARWIKTEFALVYPPLAAATSFSVECAYVFPDKRVKRVTVERQIPAGWTGSVHAQGISGTAADWPVGSYVVSCWNNGEKMSEGSFEIFDSGVGHRESGGRLRFYAGTPDAAAEPAYQTTFALGGYDSLYVEASVPVRAMADSANFGCLVTDPAGITSGFRLTGSVMERQKELVARGPVGVLDPPRVRGSYRVECRTGRTVLTHRFEVTGEPERTELNTRLVTLALFAGDAEPGDEAVPDVSFSAARLKALWLVALLDHPSDAGAGTAGYSCRVTNARNTVVADTGPQQLSVEPGARALLVRQKLALLPRQRWTVGKYAVSCATAAGPLLTGSFDLSR